MISWLKRRKMNIKTHSSPDLASRSSVAAHLQSASISPDKEIEHYKSRLLQFGIKICEMPKLTPHSKKTRLDAYAIASYIANNTELKSLFLTKKGLPASQLSEEFPDKSFKRYTPYIIAIALIIVEDYHYLKGYLPE
ncbi:hypothetical protein [Fictibacillus fluitans]|uniref:Uncharacterized protein n=1 Tax=Fictibacillus fluitans TaxID=3058422 RepID=A0ABT8I164_9BACL|nr:hypothetical protein [Fictibacillus sp. NE201]MDN4526773.1 hypothetical protein [Fictibacillus sp. NE201]